MNTATPQSLPAGESSSAGMSVSTAATMNAASGAVRVTKGSGSLAAGGAAAGPAAGLGCCASAGAARPAATAVPAPSRKLRRAIGALSSLVVSVVGLGSANFLSIMDVSPRFVALAEAPRDGSFVLWNEPKPVFSPEPGRRIAGPARGDHLGLRVGSPAALRTSQNNNRREEGMRTGVATALAAGFVLCVRGCRPSGRDQ